MFSSKFWPVVSIVLAIVTLILFGTGHTWQGATCLLIAMFSSLWSFALLEEHYKDTNINW